MNKDIIAYKCKKHLHTKIKYMTRINLYGYSLHINKAFSKNIRPKFFQTLRNKILIDFFKKNILFFRLLSTA